MKSFKKNLSSLLATFNSKLLTFNSDESGQILIIILLVLVVGVSIVLSLSARSITDVRTTTSTEQSNRAYFAAEAGIERALQQIKDNSAVSGSITGSGSGLGNGASYTGTITSTGGTAQAFYYSGLKDTTIQVNLRTDVLTDATGLNGGRLNVYWHTTNSPLTSDTAALEITLLRKNTSTGAYSLDKYACDPFVSTRSNGFNCSGSASSSFTISGNCLTTTLSGLSNTSITNFCNKVGLTINASANEKTLLARIRPIYSGDGIAVEYANSTGTAPALTLPQQGYTISSTGIGPDGSNRKLVVFRSFPSLPTVFDFVLYNGSNNALQKP